MTSALAVSRWFIARGIEAGKPVCHIKIQKLLYFAQGFFLAYTGGKRLFGERIEAWMYGPVVSSVYQELKVFGNQKISQDVWEAGATTALLTAGDVGGYEPFLEDIWKAFGRYSAFRLVEITHLPGSPWYEIYQRRQEVPARGYAISERGMMVYFQDTLRHEESRN